MLSIKKVVHTSSQYSKHIIIILLRLNYLYLNNLYEMKRIQY